MNTPLTPIYLDYAATTPIHRSVVATMSDCALDSFANPASQHAAGRAARRVLEQAKEQLALGLGANMAGMQSDRLIITSGGTESNNLILNGLTQGRTGRIVVSAIEHPSVMEMAKQLQRRGYDVQRAAVDRNGLLDLGHFKSLLSEDTLLASVMLGNNETGVLQPVKQAAQLCAAAGVPLHTDATQAAGQYEVDFRQLGVAALTAAAHKFYGPRGVGLLLLRHDVQIEPLLHGGFQQLGFRSGTESVAPVVGMLAAFEICRGDPNTYLQQVAMRRDTFEQRLASQLGELVISGQAAPRMPHISNVAFPGHDRQALVMALDQAGIACSTGSACASGSSEPSPTLLAMGCEKEIVDSSVRFSFGAMTTEEEIDAAVERIVRIVHR